MIKRRTFSILVIALLFVTKIPSLSEEFLFPDSEDKFLEFTIKNNTGQHFYTRVQQGPVITHYIDGVVVEQSDVDYLFKSVGWDIHKDEYSLEQFYKELQKKFKLN